MNEILDSLYEGVNVIVDRKIQSMERSKVYVGNIVSINGRTAKVTTSSGEMSAYLTEVNRFVEVGSTVMVNDIYGDGSSCYIETTIRGDGVGGGGGGGNGRSGFALFNPETGVTTPI